MPSGNFAPSEPTSHQGDDKASTSLSISALVRSTSSAGIGSSTSSRPPIMPSHSRSSRDLNDPRGSFASELRMRLDDKMIDGQHVPSNAARDASCKSRHVPRYRVAESVGISITFAQFHGRGREIRRRTRVVGAFPDGQSCLNLAAARLRPIGGTTWSAKCYVNMRPLYAQQFYETGAVA